MTTIRIANTPKDPNDPNVKRGDGVMVARGANDFQALLLGNVVLPEVTSSKKGHSINVNDSGNVEWVSGYDKNFTPTTLTSGTFQDRYRFIVLSCALTAGSSSLSLTNDSATVNGPPVTLTIPIVPRAAGSVLLFQTVEISNNRYTWARKFSVSLNAAMTVLTTTTTNENQNPSNFFSNNAATLDYYGVR